MNKDFQTRLEVVERELAKYIVDFDGQIDPGNANHIFTDMSRAYLSGIEHSKRGFHDVDGLALDILAALAKSAAEKAPVIEAAKQAAAAAVIRYAYYLPSPDAQPDNVPDNVASGETVQGDSRIGLDPTCLPFNQFMQGPGEATDGVLPRANGLSAANMPKRSEGPSPDRSGAELFGELMLSYSGNYEMLQGIEFPRSWTEGERRNYIRYKRELEARHAAARHMRV